MNRQLNDICTGIVRILGAKGETAGTGFLVSEQWVLTCAHVVQYAGSQVSGLVRLALLINGQPLTARIETEYWRDSKQEDVAILRLQEPLPREVIPLSLGFSGNVTDHKFRCYGFPQAKSKQGMFGTGTIQGEVLDENGCRLLQISSAEVTAGFSGAPVWDEQTRRVVGMITSRIRPDEVGRLRNTAFATPSSELWRICPNLRPSGICPYVGLSAFGEEKAEFFYGRSTLTEVLLRQLRSQPTFLAVVGSSGSGKSSVVQAGVLPYLRSGRVQGFPKNLPVLKLRPSDAETPEQALLLAFSKEYDTQEDDRTIWERMQEALPQQAGRCVIFIDQFEELFANFSSNQADFIQQLNSLLQAGLGISLIITLRSDFYAALQNSALGHFLPGHQINVRGKIIDLTAAPGGNPLEKDASDLDEADLKAIIYEPARQVGLEVEEGLVNLMISDLHNTRNPLPLIEFVLAQLWNIKQEENRLTQEQYLSPDFGRVTGALSQWVNNTYGKLSELERSLAKRIFSRLIYYSAADTPVDTRRRLSIKQLVGRTEEEPDVRRVITKLADARLLVTEGEAVEIIHDAVIEVLVEQKDASELGRWIAGGRDFARWRQRLEESLNDWQRQKEEEGYLLSDAPLGEAEGYLKQRRAELNVEECRYIEASVGKRDRLQKQKLRQAQRVAIGAVIAIGLVSATAIFAFIQQNLALQGQINSLIAESDSRSLNNDQLGALIVGIKASQLAKKTIFNPFIQDSIRAKSTLNLQRRIFNIQEKNRFEGQNEAVRGVVFSPDGKKLAIVSYGFVNNLNNLNQADQAKLPDNRVSIWDLDSPGAKSIVLAGHTNTVRDVTFSPDGKNLASASHDKTVRLWTIEGTQLQIFTGHQKNVTSVRFSPDGKTLASASADQTIKIWSLNGRLLRTLKGHQKGITEISFSPDNTMLASASVDKTIRLWKLDGTLLKILKGHKALVSTIDFSPDNRILASGSHDKTIKLWNLDGKEIKTIDDHNDIVTSVRFSPDGKVLASSSEDDTIRLWNNNQEDILAEIGQEIKTLKGHGVGVAKISFSPDGKTLASGGDDKEVKLWNLVDQHERLSFNGSNQFISKVLKGHNDEVFSVNFSPDATALISVSEKNIRLWKLDGTLLNNLVINSNLSFQPISFSLDSKLFLTSDLNSINIYDLKGQVLGKIYGALSPEHNKEGHEGEIHKLSFSPDGEIVASASSDRTVRLWNRDGSLRQVLNGHQGDVQDVNFSPNGQQIVTASSDGTLRLWEVSGRELRQWGNKSFRTGISFGGNFNRNNGNFDQQPKLLTIEKVLENSPAQKAGLQAGDQILAIDGKPVQNMGSYGEALSILRVGKPGTKVILKIARVNGSVLNHIFTRTQWTLPKSEQAQLLYTSASFSPDGTQVISGSTDGLVNLWSADGNLIQVIGDHIGPVRSVSFSPDGNLIASAGVDNVVKLWDTNGNLLRTLKGHQGIVWRVRFSPDGKIIATVSWDGTVRLWNLLGQQLAKLEGIHKTPEGIVLIPELNKEGKTSRFGVVLPNSEMSGLKYGDMIVAINGKPVRDLDLEKAYGEIRGQKATELRLRVFREGQGTFNLPPIRRTGDVIPTAWYDIDFSSDGETLVTANLDGRIYLWKKDGSPLRNIKTAVPWQLLTTRSAQFNPKNDIIVSATYSSLHFWDQSGSLTKVIHGKRSSVSNPDGHQLPISGASFSPDGKTIASIDSRGDIKIWKRDGTFIKTLQSRDKQASQTGMPFSVIPLSVIFSPNGRMIASTNNRGEINIWDNNGNFLKALDGNNKNSIVNIKFSADSKTIVSSSLNGSINLWDINNGELKHLETNFFLPKIDISPDNKIVAVAEDNTIQFWNRNGIFLATLTDHEASVRSIAFSPDGQVIASGNKDKTVRLWSLNPDSLLVRSCAWVYDYLKNPAANLGERDRQLCDDIPIPSQSNVRSVGKHFELGKSN